MNSNITPILIGNAFRENSHGGHGYDIFHENGICRCLNAASGGAAQTLVMIEEPIACAMRGRNPQDPSDRTTGAPTEQRLELGGVVSNCLTSVQKDSLVIEPTIQRVGNVYPSKGQGGVVVNPNGLSPAVCECHGEVTRVVEPKIIGYSRDSKGKVIGHHFKSESNTLNCGGGSTAQYIAEPRVVSVGNRNPSGHGIGGEVYDCEGLAPTLCVNKGSGYTISESESLTQKSQNMEQQPQYRIRKLTPVETGRLMGMDDADIHKMLDPKDEKGKPIISKSQAYKLHGNSIVVDVLYYIFRKMFIDTTSTQSR